METPNTTTNEVPFVIGAAGGAYLKNLLEKSTNPRDTIGEFQSQYGLNHHANSDPAITMLTMLELSRGDIYRSTLEHLTKKLLHRIDTLNPIQLQRLLLSTFPYIEFPELRQIPIAILSAQAETPSIFLRKLTENKEIIDELPLKVQQRIWLVDVHEMIRQIFRVIDMNISEHVESQSWDCFSKPVEAKKVMSQEKRRKHERKQLKAVHELMQMLNQQTNLYHKCMEAFRLLVADPSVHVNQLIYVGNLRLNCILFQRDHMITNLLRCDDVHPVAWMLEALLVADGPMTFEKLGELLQCIHDICFVKPLPSEPVTPTVREPPKHTIDRELASAIVSPTTATSPKPERLEQAQEDLPPKLDPSSLIKILDKLGQIDNRLIFAQPVPVDDIPGYLDIIAHPMDLSTMREKVMKEHVYLTMDDFAADFQLMIQNCLTFNPATSIFVKEAKKLQKKGHELFQKERQRLTSTRQHEANERRKDQQLVKEKKRKAAKELAKATAEKKKRQSSPKFVGTLIPGVYTPSLLLDIRLLLSDPQVSKLLYETLFRCLEGCLERRTLPQDHPMIPGIIQLLTLGDVTQIRRQARSRVTATNPCLVSKPDASLLRVVLPLLIRITFFHTSRYQDAMKEQHAGLRAQVSQMTPPMLDKSWGPIMASSGHVCRKIIQMYLLEAIRTDVAIVYKNILEHIATLEAEAGTEEQRQQPQKEEEEEERNNHMTIAHRMKDDGHMTCFRSDEDQGFFHALVSMILVHKTKLPTHLRAITMDEFLVSKCRQLNLAHEQRRRTTKDQEDPPCSDMFIIVHTQMARLLVESSAGMSESDVRGYVNDVLGSGSSLSSLENLWSHHAEFRHIRSWYEKLFRKYSDLRESLGLPSTLSAIEPLVKSVGGGPEESSANELVQMKE